MQTNVFQSVSAAISRLPSAPTVEIRAHRPAGSGLARIVADVYHTSESSADHKQVLAALSQKFGGKLQAVAGTFQSLSKNHVVERISGIISVNKQTVFVPENGELNGFRALASNMFMDEEQEMWVLRRGNNGSLLIKTTGVEDDVALASLLEAQCSAQGGGTVEAFQAVASTAVPKVEGGDAITYINDNNQTTLAFVVASVQGSDDLIVQALDADEPETIKPEAIVDVHNTDEFPEDEMDEAESVSSSLSAARGVVSMADISAYYKRVFARNKDFYNEFMKRFRSHKFA